MALGKQVVAKIFQDDVKSSNVKHVKGIFTHQRDYAIICRFYYHYKLRDLRYEVAVNKLSEEFYLGETTIAQIVMRESNMLERLKAENADKKHLNSLLPHYSWD